MHNGTAEWNLSSGTERVAEVDTNNVSGASVKEEVGEMSVSNANHPLTERDERVTCRKVALQHEERFPRLTHAEVGASETM